MARFVRHALGMWLLLLIVVWTAVTAAASEIRMKNGDLYSNTAILRRDATSIEVRVRYGSMTLPLDTVDRIDGALVMPGNPPDSPPVRGTRPAATPLRAASPTPATPRPSVPAPTTAKPTQAAPSASIASAPKTIPDPPAATSSVWNWLPRFGQTTGLRWWQTALLVLAFLIVATLWVVTLPRLRRDLRDQEGRSRKWYAVAILLPGLGYLFSVVTQRLGRTILLRRSKIEEQNRFEFLDADHNPILIQEGDEAFSGIENARHILEYALRKRASDVHIEPFAQEYRVRLRVDGGLVPNETYSPADGLRLVSAIKTLGQIDIAERRKAQDGRFGGRRGTHEVDFRVATVPSVFGEKLVLRILDRKAGLRGLSDLGMPEEMMARFAQIVHSRSGMILATGPTGSGKTSTLYAALTQLDASHLNLVTIEDPVEYELAGATQIPVNAKAGVTYESGLRSILRQDPDVILVGEIRDMESAQIALRSALTGHLVFSSLHTRDAIGAVVRLEEMGLEPHLVASALFVVMSQRLVRVLCEACRKPYACTGNELISLGIELNPEETLYQAVGCRRCEGSGFIGRTGIFEMLVLDDDIRQHVNDGIGENELLKLARQKGYRNYREDGAMKVLLGITTPDEVLKAN